MYADDVQMYTSCDLHNLNDGIANMNSDLNRVWQWAAGNELSLNPCKSKSILISRQKLDHVCIPQIKMNGSCVELVDQVKNLGIIFTKDLLWSAHINTAVGKVYGMLRTLWVTQKYTPLHIRMLLAKSFLLPTLFYGCEIYASCDSTDKYKLNKLFNTITRYVFCLRKYDHVSNFSVKLFSMSFDDLLKYKVLLFLQKIIVNKEPFYLSNKLKFLSSMRFTNIQSIRCNYLVSERQFFVFAIRLWNLLPPYLTLIKTSVHFKSKLFEFMSTNNV